MKNIIITILLFHSFCLCLAQQITYSKVITGSATAQSICPTSDNGFILAGSAFVFYGEVKKIDSLGNVEWSKFYYDSLADYSLDFKMILPTIDSNYIVLGNGYRISNSKSISVIIKINPNGDTLWSKVIDFPIYGTYANDIITTKDSGFIIAGYIDSSNIHKGFITKLSKNGNLLWSKEFKNRDNYYECLSVKETADSGFIIGGIGLKQFLKYISFSKFDNFGNPQWTNKYKLNTSFSSIKLNDMVVTNTGITFYSSSSTPILFQTDFSGNIIWAKNYSLGPSVPYISHTYKLHKTLSNGYVFVSGGTNPSFIIVADSLGNLEFSKSVTLLSRDIIETKDKGFVVSGYGYLTFGSLTTSPTFQAGIIKLDSNLNGQNCIGNYASASNSVIMLVELDTLDSKSAGNISYISPSISNSGHISTIGCVLFPFSLNNKTIVSETMQIGPNPSNGAFEIIQSENKPSRITIYNAIGKIILQKNITDYKTIINLSDYPDGLYTYTIFSNSKSLRNGKILIQK